MEKRISIICPNCKADMPFRLKSCFSHRVKCGECGTKTDLKDYGEVRGRYYSAIVLSYFLLIYYVFFLFLRFLGAGGIDGLIYSFTIPGMISILLEICVVILICVFLHCLFIPYGVVPYYNEQILRDKLEKASDNTDAVSEKPKVYIICPECKNDVRFKWMTSFSLKVKCCECGRKIKLRKYKPVRARLAVSILISYSFLFAFVVDEFFDFIPKENINTLINHTNIHSALDIIALVLYILYIYGIAIAFCLSLNYIFISFCIVPYFNELVLRNKLHGISDYSDKTNDSNLNKK